MPSENPADATISPFTSPARIVSTTGEGRRYFSSRPVRLGDVDPADELRFDALARYAQDIANDDAIDARLSNALHFVVRKTIVEVTTPAVFREQVELVTFCNGLGTRWAGRQTEITGAQGASIAMSTVWVHVDPDAGRPKRLGDQFTDTYAASAAGHTANARLHHRPPTETTTAPSLEWPFRRADLDLLDHVNNAIYWSAVEELIAHLGIERTGLRAELEYKAPVPPGRNASISWQQTERVVEMWLQDSETSAVYATALLAPFEPYESASLSPAGG